MLQRRIGVTQKSPQSHMNTTVKRRKIRAFEPCKSITAIKLSIGQFAVNTKGEIMSLERRLLENLKTYAIYNIYIPIDAPQSAEVNEHTSRAIERV